MGNYELIELLCNIVREQTDIIQKQAEIIALADIPENVSERLSKMRVAAANRLGAIQKRI